MIPVGLGSCRWSDVLKLQWGACRIWFIRVLISVGKRPLSADSGGKTLVVTVAFLQQQVRGAITNSALQHDIIRPLKVNGNIDPLQADLP